MCEQLAQSCYMEQSGRDSNLRPLGCKSDALNTTPPRHKAAYGKKRLITMFKFLSYRHDKSLLTGTISLVTFINRLGRLEIIPKTDAITELTSSRQQ